MAEDMDYIFLVCYDEIESLSLIPLLKFHEIAYLKHVFRAFVHLYWFSRSFEVIRGH